MSIYVSRKKRTYSEARTRLDNAGQITIPASILKALDVNVGDEIGLRLEDGEIIITRIKPRGEGGDRSEALE
jgi:AbrB family looped-hinge helix DNA binding protein